MSDKIKSWADEESHRALMERLFSESENDEPYIFIAPEWIKRPLRAPEEQNNIRNED